MFINTNGSELRWGPSLRLLVTLTGKGETELISRTYCIDDLVELSFKYVSERTANFDIVNFSYSSRRIGSVENSEVKMKITCKSDSLNYSKKTLCPNEWSDWQPIGQIQMNSLNEESNVFEATYDLYVTVFEEKTLTLSEKLYQDTDFTDFHLSTVEGSSVAVHKACLATQSDVFKTMLTGKWKETAEGTIKIEGVTLQTLQQLKDYMYLGTVPDDGLRPLLLIARRYMIENLEEQCIRKLAESVSAEELFSLIEFACDNNIPELAFAIPKLTQDKIICEAHNLRKKAALPKPNGISI